MAQTRNQSSPGTQTPRTKSSGGISPATTSGATTVSDSAGFFLHLNCSVCSGRFVLDVEEWRAPPEESELTGREFLGIPLHATLCPFCLRSVQLAGAEHIYWRVADA